MRYHIDTIPVWDAYQQGGECPFCDLRVANEQSYLESFLGASVMEPDVRIEVNQKGFCGPHFAQMITLKNRLGLALMTHTYLLETMEKFAPPAKPKARHPFQKKEAVTFPRESCILCDRLSQTMDRYLYTALHLWQTDPAFKEVFEASKGLCLPHYQAILRMSDEALSAKGQVAFRDMLYDLQRKSLGRIEEELKWFTLKFDYRNADKPWGNSKDSLERAINKLRGKSV